MISPGQLLTLTIEKPAAGGRMIARSESGIVLVSGAVPGERVTARVERLGKGVVFAGTVAVLEPSEDRREPFVDPQCGGCLYAHIAYARQLALKSQVIADAFGRIGHIPLEAPVGIAPSRDDGYRMRARLHVRDGGIGLFREGSYQLCDARATRQLLPETCDALDATASALRSRHAGITGAAAAEGLRELHVSENLDASQRVMHLDASPGVDQAVLRLLGQSGGLTGLTVGSGEVLAGDPYVADTFEVGGHHITLRRHVLSFFQGNRYLLRDLVAYVMQPIEDHAEVIDLYAGVGLFSIAAAVVRGATVTAVEGDRWAAADLALNATGLGIPVEAVHRPVEEFVRTNWKVSSEASRGRPRRPARGGPAVLIVDPPRTGMSKEALEGSIRLRPRTIVYVSCDVATLARDARRLLDAGYSLHQIAGFDLFPNTPHVETVAVFLIS
jgi:23S rRNA (uracil1939-C5)-methyltransferase